MGSGVHMGVPHWGQLGVCVLIGVWGPYGGDLWGGGWRGGGYIGVNGGGPIGVWGPWGGGVPYLGSVGPSIGVRGPIRGSHWGRGAVSHAPLPALSQSALGGGAVSKATFAPPPGNSRRQWAPTWGGGATQTPPPSLKAKTPKSDPPNGPGDPPTTTWSPFPGGGGWSSKIPPPPLTPLYSVVPLHSPRPAPRADWWSSRPMGGGGALYPAESAHVGERGAVVMGLYGDP